MLECETPSIVPPLSRSLVLPSWSQWCLGIKGWTGVHGGLMSRGKETAGVDSKVIDSNSLESGAHSHSHYNQEKQKPPLSTLP